MYQQLSEEKHADFNCVKKFAAHCLQPGETVDVFLAQLCRHAVLSRGVSEEGLQCAFIAGLPEHAEQLIQGPPRWKLGSTTSAGISLGNTEEFH